MVWKKEILGILDKWWCSISLFGGMVTRVVDAVILVILVIVDVKHLRFTQIRWIFFYDINPDILESKNP